MDAFLTSGRIADVILALMIVEGVLLLWLWRARRIGLPPGELATTILSGACLLLALRGALTGAGALAVVAPLILALAAHLCDLWMRWRR